LSDPRSIADVIVTFIFHAEHDVIVTGEWCHEVFAEYALNVHEGASYVDTNTAEGKHAMLQQGGFTGRGVQYYLGFHHAQDSCR
jgi:hypothetical protein